jgi:two-component system KDP operon response regulator KdpE
MNAAGPRVLVVDDDPAIRRFLRIALRTHGYTVLEAGSGGAALAATSNLRPDILILDLGLPDVDGIEVTRRLRHRDQIPILILSVRNQEEDKITALEAGADDYLTKPFGVGELHARLRVLLRRVAGSGAGAPFRLGDLEVDLTRRTVRVRGAAVQLTPTEYEVLKVFSQSGGRVLTHQHMLRQVCASTSARCAGSLRTIPSNRDTS